MKCELKEYRLSDVCERIYSGGTPSTKHSDYWNGSVRWMSSGETSQSFIGDTKRRITEKGVNNSSVKLAVKGCTVIAAAGQGHTRGQASFLEVDTYISQSVIACKANENIILPLYLYYNLAGRYEEFRLLSDGTSTRGGLSGWIIKRMPIKVPDIHVQERIVSILYSIDEKIELNIKINNNLERQVSTLYQAWFEDRINSGGDLSDARSLVTLSDIAEINSGRRPPVRYAKKTDEAQIPIVGAASVVGFTNKANQSGKILAIGRVGTHGVIQRYDSPCWASDNTLVITTKYYEYVCQLLKRIDYSSMNRGSTQPLIAQGDMRRVAVILPDNNTLSRFEGVAGALMEKHQANIDEGIRLAQLRDTLLPKLMSGELDASDIDI